MAACQHAYLLYTYFHKSRLFVLVFRCLTFSKTTIEVISPLEPYTQFVLNGKKSIYPSRVTMYMSAFTSGFGSSRSEDGLSTSAFPCGYHLDFPLLAYEHAFIAFFPLYATTLSSTRTRIGFLDLHVAAAGGLRHWNECLMEPFSLQKIR